MPYCRDSQCPAFPDWLFPTTPITSPSVVIEGSVRYVERNPVSAGLCEKPQDWRWSSVHAHLDSNDDELVSVKPMLERFPDWGDYLGDFRSNELLRNIRKHTRTGRPLGSESFIETLESLTGRSLKSLKPGRKPIK